MLPPQRRVMIFLVIAVTLCLILLLLTPNYHRPVRLAGRPGSSTGGGGGGGSVDSTSSCPTGQFVTVSALGRLGNNLCQYASLWSLQRDDYRARPAWLLPEMQRALTPLFAGLELPTLTEACVKQNQNFRVVEYSRFAEVASSRSRRSLLLSNYPCDLRRFYQYRESVLGQLTFRPAVRRQAQRRLRQRTASLCGGGSPRCTFVGVHVRRTDYDRLLKRIYNGTLAGETYLRRAMALCHRRYRRPVFVVSSDDLAWVRQHLRAPDVVIAGSRGDGSAGRDLALLAQCNHTIMTHGTYGFWAAFLTQGDVIVPTGFGVQDSYLSITMRKKGFNITTVPAF